MKRKVSFLTIALCLLVSSQAMAQSDIGFKRLGGAIGYVSPENFDGTIGFGVFADLGQITPQISLEPRVDYWSQSEEAFGTEFKVSDIAVGMRGKYFFEVNHPSIRPFAGVGLGLHFLNAEATVTVPGFPPVSADDSSTKLGLDFGGGIATALNPKTDVHAELWYGIVDDASQFSLRLGMSFMLGK